jgi:hypothetical protein
MSVPDENALEPVELIKQSGAVLRVGHAMIRSGTGSCLVKTAVAGLGPAGRVVLFFGAGRDSGMVWPLVGCHSRELSA